MTREKLVGILRDFDNYGTMTYESTADRILSALESERGGRWCCGLVKWVIYALFCVAVIAADLYEPKVEIVPNARPHLFTAGQSNNFFRNNTDTAFWVWTHDGRAINLTQRILVKGKK